MRQPLYVPVQLPEGWVCRYPGIPDMDAPAGFWKAVKPDPVATFWLKILWVPSAAKYLCEHWVGDEEPREARTFNYPHEVVEWLQMWVNRIERRCLQE